MTLTNFKNKLKELANSVRRNNLVIAIITLTL